MEEKKQKMIYVISSNTLSKLIKKANEMEISKEDIISLNKSEGEFHLTYYK